MRRFVARQHSTPARGQTRELSASHPDVPSANTALQTGLVYVVTDSNGSNPRHLHINRANSSSLPTPGEESRYVDHVVLVACAKTVSICLSSLGLDI